MSMPNRSTAVLLVLLLVLAALGLVPAVARADDADGLPEDAPDQLTTDEDNAEVGHDTCGDEPVADSGSEIHRKLIDGPRQPGSDALAFTSGVCIYLPPDYRTSDLHYPVLYLLHGAFGWQDDWVVQGDLQAIMDRVRDGDPTQDMIVVMPDGGYMAEWRDEGDGSLQIESYVIDHVIPYVDTWFRTIPDRRGRAMAGLSNGGAGTLRMAAHHPDRFSVVTAMSAALPVNAAADRTDVYAVHNDPTELAANLNEVELALTWGQTCGTAAECTDPDLLGGYGFEQACCNNWAYVAQLERVRTREYVHEPTAGGHSWPWWQLWLEVNHGEFLRDHLADPVADLSELGQLGAPREFGHRSIDDVVDIYGWTIRTDEARATEMLELSAVTSAGLTLTGSGLTTVTTPPSHTPGHSVTVRGTGVDDGPVVADDQGRLTFEVDLGAANTTSLPPAVAAASAVTRAVSFEAAGTLAHRSLDNARGDYHYYLYTPAGYDSSVPTPVQLVIHGANTVAMEQVLSNGHHAVADREGFMVLYPDFVNEGDTKPEGGESTIPSLVGTHPGRLWDSNDLTSRATGQGDAAAIVAMVEDVASIRTLDRDRVYVSGMSSGGMMTSLLMGLYPDVFAAAGIIGSCGFTAAACVAEDVQGLDEVIARAAHEAMGDHARVVPFVQIHGLQDATIPPSAADFSIRQWLMTHNLTAGGDTTEGPFALEPAARREGIVPEGHTYTVDTYVDADGCVVAEAWTIPQMGHYWPGGSADPTWAEWTDHRAPSGAEATWAFFAQHTLDGPTDEAC